MEKIPVSPWNELPKSYRLAHVEDLLEEWPDMSQEDREHVMFHDPELVVASGLWPGREHEAESFDEIRALLDAEQASKGSEVRKPPPPLPWNELREDVRDALCNSLRKDWPTMSEEFRRFKMEQDPDLVKAAGLWPEEGTAH